MAWEGKATNYPLPVLSPAGGEDVRKGAPDTLALLNLALVPSTERVRRGEGKCG
jgi:hypothetical protein